MPTVPPCILRRGGRRGRRSRCWTQVPGPTAELFHVELSRVSEEFLLLTDDRRRAHREHGIRPERGRGAGGAGDRPVRDPRSGPRGVRGGGRRTGGRCYRRARRRTPFPFSSRPTGTRWPRLRRWHRSRTSRRTCAASPAPCWPNTGSISRMTARCRASSRASGTTGGAGRSSAGRPPRRVCRWTRSPNTLPGATKGRRFCRRAGA